MKEHILSAIYREFEQWSTQLNFSCQKGCSNCCTQNVTMTALEGTRIHRFIRKNGKEKWLAEALYHSHRTIPPQMTTNEYAAACLQGQDVTPGAGENPSPCPFLENDCCMIYEVRPFGCRCFGSRIRCSPGQEALLPEYYITASTAVMQVIEHLGQFEYWGNMIDVLLAMCDMTENRNTSLFLHDHSLSMQARIQTLTAKPLPGFLIPEDDHKRVDPLLTAIFSAKIDDRTIEQILNNR